MQCVSQEIHKWPAFLSHINTRHISWESCTQKERCEHTQKHTQCYLHVLFLHKPNTSFKTSCSPKRIHNLWGSVDAVLLCTQCEVLYSYIFTDCCNDIGFPYFWKRLRHWGSETRTFLEQIFLCEKFLYKDTKDTFSYALQPASLLLC